MLPLPKNKYYFFFFCLLCTAIFCEAKKEYNILLIHTQNPSVPSSQEVRQGIVDTLNKAGVNYILQEEFIRRGLEELPSFTGFMQSLFEKQVEAIDPDVIIVNANGAMELFLDFESAILSKRNLIFCAIPTYNIRLKKKYPNSSAIVDYFPLKENIDLALETEPDIERIIFVGNSKKTENKYRIPIINTLEKHYKHRVEFIKYFDIPVSQIYKELIASETKDVIIELKHFTDDTGTRVYGDEFYPDLHKKNDIPVYSFWPSRRGYTILGGMFFNEEKKGANAAKIAIDFFNGKELSKVPIQTINNSEPSFYYDHLKRYHIDLDTLPANYRIIGKPNKLNATQIKLIISSVFAIILLSILVIYLLYNISKRKQSEELLRHSILEKTKAKEEAEKANEIKSMFLANVTHELRTPLNSITGFSDILIRRKNLDEYSYDKLKIISKNARNLLDLINNILDLSTIESGKLEIQKKSFNLKELLRDIKELFELSAEEKGLHFEMIELNELPEYIISDELRIRQILINLIGNAIKFTEEGGVKLYINCQFSTNSRHLNFLEFSVEDTGIGIAEKNQKNIFENFVQQADDPQKNHPGTGLGLAISKRLCKHLHGSITVDSQLGEGSCFRFKLNKLEAALMASKEINTSPKTLLYSQPKSLTHSKILFVDDYKINHEIITEFLDHKAISLYFAENGEEAIDLALCENPDLILMDLDMPIMSGELACRKLRQNAKTKAIPIILLTASTSVAEIISEELDLEGVLHKPVKYEDLLLTIKEHIFD